ncbi:MAG TPA: hypothetical protein VFT72_01240 [Opitutaceae bacterium]|nr:hypothetical protein [Opitutaceae bacterium]
MTHDTILSPSLLNALAIFIVATGVLMVAAHTSLLALAARRTTLPPRTQFIAPLFAAILLAGWLAWAVLAVPKRVVIPEPLALPGQVMQNPGLLLEMTAFVGLGVVVIFASKTMRVLNAATPPAWLIGVQVYRVAGVMFLWPFLASSALPTLFAVCAGVGDVITGIAAPFVASAVARNRPGAHAKAVLWNYFGILDLVVATITAVLSHSTNISRFPLVIVPLFLGPPLGILTHIYSLRNLALSRSRMSTSEGESDSANASASRSRMTESKPAFQS